jgi:hypothetical protein
MSNTVTPQEHDVIWLELSQALHIAVERLVQARKTIVYVADFRPQSGYRGAPTTWSRGHKTSPERVSGLYESQAFEIALPELEAGRDGWALQYSGRKGTFIDALAEATVVRDAAVEALRAHEANYTGWSRYFLVVSSNGLIHSSTNCNKGRSATRFALLPTLSGLGWETAVDALGPSLCSICFPEAPTSVVDGPKLPSRITELLFGRDGVNAFQAELAKYNAKRAAKAAK